LNSNFKIYSEFEVGPKMKVVELDLLNNFYLGKNSNLDAKFEVILEKDRKGGGGSWLQ